MKCQCKSPKCDAELQVDTLGGTITVIRTDHHTVGKDGQLLPNPIAYTNAILVYMTRESAEEMIKKLQEYIKEGVSHDE